MSGKNKQINTENKTSGVLIKYAYIYATSKIEIPGHSRNEILFDLQVGLVFWWGLYSNERTMNTTQDIWKTCLKNSYHLCLILTKELEVIYLNLGGKLNYYFLVNVMRSSEFDSKNMRIYIPSRCRYFAYPVIPFLKKIITCILYAFWFRSVCCCCCFCVCECVCIFNPINYIFLSKQEE